jgi:general stress protein 26
MKKNSADFRFVCLLISMLPLFSLQARAQVEQKEIPRDSLLLAAREIISSTPFCALATIDAEGLPQMRTMNPFPVEDEMVIWFATSRTSRKVAEIKNNPRVCVYFADHGSAKGYVALNGTAEILDDKELLVKMKRAYWEGIPNWQDIFVLIKITPVTIDVINYAHGISGDPKTSRSPTIIF